ncbi:MAG: hypothetical protein COT84_03555 [Chlamydiae bacterium CG10_big_fil_rev_8_21_14_0_10_35_9]|nr:MAG: hypothetical protein COT84_03555 [Chlamydiae bacterium CG10_big_fil_rev_8_21_14_0_10_35_9]
MSSLFKTRINELSKNFFERENVEWAIEIKDFSSREAQESVDELKDHTKELFQVLGNVMSEIGKNTLTLVRYKVNKHKSLYETAVISLVAVTFYHIIFMLYESKEPLCYERRFFLVD